MSAPFFGLYPLFRPKRIIMLSFSGDINSNGFITSDGLSNVYLTPPDYGRFIIFVNVGNSGYFGIKIFNGRMGYIFGGGALNGGNALSANVWYKFEVPAVPGTLGYNFWWLSSSSGVNSTLIQVVVIWEPTETPPSAGATD